MQGDCGGKVNIFEGDIIGRCERKKRFIRTCI